MSSKAQGGNDILTGGNNSSDGYVVNNLYGDAGGSMSGSAKGGNDTLTGGNNSGSGIVVAGSPCDSGLIQKIGDGAPFGARMRFNGPPHLAPADQQRIRDWIAEGALDN